MSARFVLRRESRRFSDWLTRLVNGTVGNNVRLKSEQLPHGNDVLIATSSRERIPLRIGTGKPTGFIELVYYVGADLSGRFLMVKSSFVEISRDPWGREPLLHYDFERDKRGGYPEAHLQIHATSEPSQRFTDRDLHKLHLPVAWYRGIQTKALVRSDPTLAGAILDELGGTADRAVPPKPFSPCGP